jgi:hypothetical protein
MWGPGPLDFAAPVLVTFSFRSPVSYSHYPFLSYKTKHGTVYIHNTTSGALFNGYLSRRDNKHVV